MQAICHKGLLGLFSATGRAAALNMLNKTTRMDSVPFFWTVLLGKSIRYAGDTSWGTLPPNLFEFKLMNSSHELFFFFLFNILGYGEGYTEIIFKGKVEEGKFLAFYIK